VEDLLVVYFLLQLYLVHLLQLHLLILHHYLFLGLEMMEKDHSQIHLLHPLLM
jgi:hypothetical protein